MPRAKSADRYVQYASINVTESAANTLTFQQLTTGGMLFERRAFVIHRIEYNLDLGTHLVDESDSIIVGMSVNNTLGTISQSDPNLIDYREFRVINLGTAASGAAYHTPFSIDFSALPGAGLIVPSHPIFGYVQGTSLSSAVSLGIKFYFTLVELSAEEFVELVEAMRVIT